MMLVFPSDDRLVVVGGDRAGMKAELALVQAALKAGKGAIGENAELGALMKKVDAAGGMWVVAKLTKEMRVSILEPFETITMEAKEKAGTVSYTIIAAGDDEEKVKTQAAAVEADLAQTVAQGQAEVARRKSVQPALDAVASMKVAAAGKGATLTGEIKNTVVPALLGELGASFLLSGLLGEGIGMETEASPPIGPAVPGEVPPAPPAEFAPPAQVGPPRE
jgi:hypothetical protein